MSTPISVDEAIDRLAVVPDYDPGGEGGPGPCVHSFATAGGIGLIGAHLRLDEVRELFERAELLHECEGPVGHNIATIENDCLLYWETEDR